MKKAGVIMHKSFLVNDLYFFKDVCVDGYEIDAIAIPKIFHDKGLVAEYNEDKDMLSFYFQSHDKCQYGVYVEVYFIGEIDDDDEDTWNWHYNWSYVKNFWQDGMYFIWKREGSNIC